MASSICILGLLIMINLLRFFANAQQQTYHKKFEYKHSFRGPNLSQRDGTVPYWEIVGDAIASSERLRLAPSMQSKTGAAWNTRPLTKSEFWEMEMSFKVTGQDRIGADGLAFWYTAAKGALGNVFGSNDYWTGLGIFFDSYDNDAQHDNPFIMMMINDGTRTYDHQKDGSQQMLTKCQIDYRNRLFPVKIKIKYLENILTVHIHDGRTLYERYELCMRAGNIFLPRLGYFGLSAATGTLTDDHDILSFSVFSLSTQIVQQPIKLNQIIPVIKCFEVNEMLTISRELSSNVKEIRSFVANIQQRIVTLDTGSSDADQLHLFIILFSIFCIFICFIRYDLFIYKAKIDQKPKPKVRSLSAES